MFTYLYHACIYLFASIEAVVSVKWALIERPKSVVSCSLFNVVMMVMLAMSCQ